MDNHYGQPTYLTDREEEIQEQVYKTCEIACTRFLISDMVEDKDNGCWVSKEYLKEYLDICKGEMLWDDYQDLENKLLKQI